jgi:hypothetical protein
LVRQAESYERLKREVEAGEREARIHEKLDGWLGKTGLQRELVRDAETQIVRLANDSGGRADEWHLDLSNVFRHLAFDFAAWLCQAFEVVAPPLYQSRFKTIGSVSHSMGRDGTE